MPSLQIGERDACETSFQVLLAEIGHVADTLEVSEALQHSAVRQVFVHDSNIGNTKKLPFPPKKRIVCSKCVFSKKLIDFLGQYLQEIDI